MSARRRSRFDQDTKPTEPMEPRKRVSRFDRRSRSPPPARSDDALRHRSRSPREPDNTIDDAGGDDRGERSGNTKDGRVDGHDDDLDPSAVAAAAAARINAAILARNMPPEPKSPGEALAPNTVLGKPSTLSTDVGSGDSEGAFVQDIDINDVGRNRYLLTRGSTAVRIHEASGATITTRGNYYPDKTMATPSKPALHLHIVAPTQESLDKAVAKIDELMKEELPTLIDQRRLRRRDQPETAEARDSGENSSRVSSPASSTPGRPSLANGDDTSATNSMSMSTPTSTTRPPFRDRDPRRDDHGGRRNKWPEVRVPVNIDPVPGFHLRAQVVGQGGAYVKHIQAETGCRVQIKGRGSGFIEHGLDRESDDDPFLHILGPDPAMVEKAKELCEDLLVSVREQHEHFKSRPPRHHHYDQGFRDRRDRTFHRHDDRPYNNNNNNNHRQHQDGRIPPQSSQPAQQPASNPYSPPAPQSQPQPPTADAEYAQQYAQYYNGQDPYAAYGGYEAYAQWYQQYYAAAMAQQQAQPTTDADVSQPPPPPDDNDPPPPPPDQAPPPPGF